jgi:Fe-S cluster assembly iron-binding protein IscA
VKCKVTPAAKKQILEMMKQQTDKNLKLRVYVTEAHGDDAHYGIGLDYQKPNDIVNAATPGLEILLERNNEFLNNIVVDYDGHQNSFLITNPTKGHHHHH